MKQTWVLVTMIGLVGCQAGSPATDGRTYQIVETPTTLDIVARDARQQTLGTVTLGTGVYSDLEDGRPIDGIQLVVKAGGRTMTHVSAGTDVRSLPLPGIDAIDQVVLAEPVQSALARHLITFEALSLTADTAPAAQTDGEIPYQSDCAVATRATSSPYACQPSCTFTTNPTCGASDCKQWQISSGVYGEYVLCDASQLVVTRKCTFANDSHNPCGQAGPGGCAVCSSVDMTLPDGMCAGDYLLGGTYCVWKTSIPI